MLKIDELLIFIMTYKYGITYKLTPSVWKKDKEMVRHRGNWLSHCGQVNYGHGLMAELHYTQSNGLFTSPGLDLVQDSFPFFEWGASKDLFGDDVCIWKGKKLDINATE